MTEKAFFGWIRSQLRRVSQRWKPIYGILKEGRRPVTFGDRVQWGNRIKFVYQCERCLQWFPRTGIEVDHIVPCGSLRSFEDVGPFTARLLCERPGLRRVCEACHLIITKEGS